MDLKNCTCTSPPLIQIQWWGVMRGGSGPHHEHEWEEWHFFSTNSLMSNHFRNSYPIAFLPNRPCFSLLQFLLSFFYFFFLLPSLSIVFCFYCFSCLSFGRTGIMASFSSFSILSTTTQQLLSNYRSNMGNHGGVWIFSFTFYLIKLVLTRSEWFVRCLYYRPTWW